MSVNNTYKHISDESKYSSFNPAGTNFPPTVNNVQDALSLTAPTSYATTAQPGVMQIATLDEVMAGTDSKKAVVPSTLAARLAHPDASTTVKGILFLATNDESLGGTNSTKAVVPAGLKYSLEWFWTNRTAKENANGVLKLSTTAAAAAGVDDTTAMTPLKVQQAIAAATSQIPSYAGATETSQGTVQLATIGQTQQGVLREGYAVSPFTLMRIRGNNDSVGMVQAASHGQANAGTDSSLYISAQGYKTYNGTETDFGTVKLSKVAGQGTAGTALSFDAAVLPLSGGTLTGPLHAKDLTSNGSPVATQQSINDAAPIGSVQMWLADSLPPGNLYRICNGSQMSAVENPALFAIIGYKFGGFGDIFYLPDMRGLFVRGAGRGRDLDAATGTDDKGKPLLGNDVRGGVVGQVQKQQVRTHKHVIPWGEDYGNPEFGKTKTRGKLGSGKTDYNNPMFFSNDGSEYEAWNVRDQNSTLNSEELMGSENRPWNMSVNYIIKVA